MGTGFQPFRSGADAAGSFETAASGPVSVAPAAAPRRLTIDQVAEMTISTSNTSAAAQGGSSQVIMVTRSGSNQYRGSAYWYNRKNQDGNNVTSKLDYPHSPRHSFSGSYLWNGARPDRPDQTNDFAAIPTVYTTGGATRSRSDGGGTRQPP